MVRSDMTIRTKMNRGTHEFVSKVLNLLSSPLVANYGSVDKSSKYCVLFGVFRILNQRLIESMKQAEENGTNKMSIECMRMGSSAFDVMSIKNKVYLILILKKWSVLKKIC